jgi:hypothetical protein
MHKEFFSLIITHSYMFRPCWVVFREKPSVVVTLGCTRCNDNGRFLAEDDPAGSKHIGVCYN